MTQINLLPWREEARKIRKTNFLYLLVAAMFLALIIIGLCYLYFTHLVNAQNARNAYIQSILANEQTSLNGLDKKRKKQNEVKQSLKFIYSLRQKNYSVVNMLDQLVRIIPEGIELTKMSRNENTVIIIGRSNSNFEITTLMNNIARSQYFALPELTQITGKETPTGEERFFQLKVETK